MQMASSLNRLALALVLVGCKQEASKLDSVTVTVPAVASGRVALDGELVEPAWNKLAVRGVFTGDDGTQARPYSEIRILRDDTHLLLGLYAADEDIRSDDAFEVTAGGLQTHLAAGGHATPASVHMAVDHDGSLDNASDDDEEWVVEAQLPLGELGPPPITIHASRCDVVKRGERRCGRWQGTIDLATLPAITAASR